MTAASVTSSRPRRGYALVIVLMVLTLMAIALGSMAWMMDATIAEGRRTIATMRSDLACASALDLAARTVTTSLNADPGLDPQDLTDTLCALGTCDDVAGVTLPRFLAPAGSTLEHFSINYGSTRGRTTRPVASGPFAGRTALEQVLMVTVVVRDNLTRRPCGSTDRYVIPSMPLMSFPLFGTAPTTRWAPPLAVRRVNDGVASSAHLNGNTSGTQISTSDFVLPGTQFTGDKDPIALGDSVDCQALTGEIACLAADCGWDGSVCRGSTRGSDLVLAPAVGTPTQSTTQASLARSFRWLVEPPASGDSKALGDTRLAEKADIVIIDGVWYNNRDKARPWPGTPIWSDRPGSTVTHVSPATGIVASTDPVGMGDLGFTAGEFPSLFSWYDRAGSADTDAIRTQTGGVLSYGPLAVKATTTSCNSDADCGGLECFRPTTSTGVCQRVEPGLWASQAGDGSCNSVATTRFRGVSDCPGSTAVVDGTRSGFRDGDRNILPINLNLATLAAALQANDLTTQRHELGRALGGPTLFNGVIYVTSRFTGGLPAPQQDNSTGMPASLCTRNDSGADSLGNCPGNSSNSVHRPRSVSATPVGLCGGAAPLAGTFGSMPCNQATRPNAVRIYNGTRVPSGAFPKGLTIATDLPLYVQGDLNRVIAAVAPDPPPPHAKIALVADRVTFLSRGWRDELHPWNDDAITTGAPATGKMVVEASIVSGLPMLSGNVHDVADLFRTPQDFDDNHFVLRGHLVAGFNSEHEARTSSDTKVGRGLRWLPDYHLNNPGFQPPGMPLVTLPPTTRWRQR